MAEEEKKEVSSTPTIDEANKASERMEAAIAGLKEQNDRAEKIVANAKLGGQSEAGQATPEQSKEQAVKKSAMEMFKGSGIDKAIEKHG